MTEGIASLFLWGGIWFVINMIPGLIAGFVWSNRGGEFTEGFWMGLGLSVIGIFIAAIAKPTRPWQPTDGSMRPPAQPKVLVR